MSENISYVNDDNFDAEIMQNKGLSIVDFYADWCRPCKMLSPIIEELAGENAGQVKVVKLDVESARRVSEKYGVMSIPTVIFFKNGEEVDRIIGLQHKSDIQARIDSHK